MANDTPDWGSQYVSAVIQPLADMGELAVRLGSVVRDDRRGAVLWMEDFAYGFNKITPGVSGSGAAYALSANPVDSGAFAAKLTSGTVAGRNASLTKILALPPEDRFGLACRFMISSIYFNFTLAIGLVTGNVYYPFAVRVRSFSTDIEIYTSGDYEVVASGVPAITSGAGWQPIKLVISKVNAAYERLVFAGQDFDLSTYTAQSQALTSPEIAWAILRAVNEESGQNSIAHIDALVFTSAEPPNE